MGRTRQKQSEGSRTGSQILSEFHVYNTKLQHSSHHHPSTTAKKDKITAHDLNPLSRKQGHVSNFHFSRLVRTRTYPVSASLSNFDHTWQFCSRTWHPSQLTPVKTEPSLLLCWVVSLPFSLCVWKIADSPSLVTCCPWLFGLSLCYSLRYWVDSELA